MLAFATLLFPGLMVFAGFSDLFTMEISNRVSIVLVAAFFVLAVTFGVPLREIGLHVACGLLVLCLTFFFFSRDWIGGGDAKLASATALWFGFDHIADYGLVSALIGGGLTLLILTVRRWPLPSFLLSQPWIARLHDRHSGIPYGIALALAGLILYPQTRIWLCATGS
jgi:prepilin peptidase CpaA